MSSLQPFSDTQQILLNVLPIPSAIASVIGSTAIIYLARERRKVKPWTPYNRLLVAMSVCDIVLSISLAISTFARPEETSTRLWAFGNDTTCSIVGFITQASTASIWYQGMLSIYFLLTARYHMKNERIVKRIEPLMHFVSLGFPIGTAILGAVMGVYGERAERVSCWVRIYPKETDSDVGAMQEKDGRLEVLVYVFYVLPAVLISLCLIYTQMSIYLFVRRHTQGVDGVIPSDHAQSIERSTRAIISIAGSERASSMNTNSSHASSKKRAPTTMLTNQSERLQLVCSQAFLFVISFLLCNCWNVIMGVLQNNASTLSEETETMANYFYIVIIQAVLLPIQGLFNFLIYIRPKYMMLRLEFQNETRFWIAKRIFLGPKLLPANTSSGMRDVTPVKPKHQSEFKSDEDETDLEDTENTARSGMSPETRLPRFMISSMTLSDADFDSCIDALEDDDRWQDASNQVPQSTPQDLARFVTRLTTLEAISEMSESAFALTPHQVNGSHLSNLSRLEVPLGSSEGRWKDAATKEGAVNPAAKHTRPAGSDCKLEIPKRKIDSMDVPIQVPRRNLDSSKTIDDVPVRLPRRFSSTQDDDDDDSSERDSNQKSCPEKSPTRPKRVLASGDAPLALPQRFLSTAPSENEE